MALTANRRRRAVVGAALGLLAVLVLPASQGRAETVLRIAAEADLKSLDPIWTTAAITAGHGFMVYDQLFAEDSKLNVKPQMVESWKSSADAMVWSFTLRPGLKWHDGSPVTAKDAVASIKRWGARIASGQLLMTRVGEVVATGDRTFEIRLKGKFGAVVEMLGASAQPLFIMREKEALTDPNVQVAEVIGSGPFVWVKSEWVPGSKWVYRKNPDYVPRSEPPDGYVGAKIAKVDRIEVTYIPDAATAVQAINAGEVDLYQYPPTDLHPILEKNPDVVVRIANKFGFQAILRPNHLVHPTNNPKIRQAMLYAIDQNAYLAAMVGNRSLEIKCWAVFLCGTPLESKAGLGPWAAGPNPERARQLLKEAGYANEPLVLMNPTENPVISAMAVVSNQLLQKAGFNVDMQNMDWGTLVTRRAVKDDPAKSKSGWHLFHTTGTGGYLANPLLNNVIPTPCDGKNWFGWPCDETLHKIHQEFITATTLAQKKEIADRLQTRFYEVVPLIPVGQFFGKVAYRKNLVGVLDNPLLVMWNVEKK
jgi:peptide/nickel transport system substrate-binding protein